ncbi:hypothetical protein T11_10487 [Trichinella zimbabwensis]|uniref:Uncharacterized protein n=1 Tax=Trichinella zimbabwensis TaxID=268475 RepID=A0A0V1H1W4_9BILA|nr:hypothetical protein T11_10487 [Trichinella zimbabwensis]
MPTFSRASSHLAHVRRRYSSRAGSQYNKSLLPKIMKNIMKLNQHNIVRDRRLYFWVCSNDMIEHMSSAFSTAY